MNDSNDGCCYLRLCTTREWDVKRRTADRQTDLSRQYTKQFIKYSLKKSRTQISLHAFSLQTDTIIRANNCLQSSYPMAIALASCMMSFEPKETLAVTSETGSPKKDRITSAYGTPGLRDFWPTHWWIKLWILQ
jgi:hypothetical protein